jgi:hypothetical protein
MSSTTSFKPHHVYALRKPLSPNSPFKFVLVVTNEEFAHRHRQQTVTVLLLSPTPRETDSEIRVQIQSKSNGGTATLPGDHWVAVDSLTFMPKANMFVTSGTEISELEKGMVRKKLANWLAL